MVLKEVYNVQKGCMNFIKNTIKQLYCDVLLQFKNNCFLLYYILKCSFSCDGKAKYLATVLQCHATLHSNMLGFVQAHTGAQRFATVSGLNDMFPGNGVQQGLRCVFSCLVGVSKMSAQSAVTCI